MSKYITGLSEIIDNYTTYLIDMSGVIHDGINPYQYSIDALNTLKAKNKNIIFFTNAPRPQEVVRKKIASLGYNCDNDKVITSGDLFLESQYRKVTREGSKMTAYILGQEHNKDLNLSDYFITTDKLEESNVLILLTFMEDTEELDKYDNILKRAITLNIPALCPNPDTVVYHGNHLRYPAGFVASKYESFGGIVEYYGKPHKEIYQFATKNINAKKSSILAIGDNLNTDILGAKNFGIDSLLISKGIYKNISNLDLFIEGHKIYPTYICDYFRV